MYKMGGVRRRGREPEAAGNGLAAGGVTEEGWTVIELVTVVLISGMIWSVARGRNATRDPRVSRGPGVARDRGAVGDRGGPGPRGGGTPAAAPRSHAGTWTAAGGLAAAFPAERTAHERHVGDAAFVDGLIVGRAYLAADVRSGVEAGVSSDVRPVPSDDVDLADFVDARDDLEMDVPDLPVGDAEEAGSVLALDAFTDDALVDPSEDATDDPIGDPFGDPFDDEW